MDGESLLELPTAILSGQYVEFVNLTPEYPAISRRLLQIHAAIAEVLHMIGAGEVIDKILQDWERIHQLDEGGADISLLDSRLKLVMAS